MSLSVRRRVEEAQAAKVPLAEKLVLAKNWFEQLWLIPLKYFRISFSQVGLCKFLKKGAFAEGLVRRLLYNADF